MNPRDADIRMNPDRTAASSTSPPAASLPETDTGIEPEWVRMVMDMLCRSAPKILERAAIGALERVKIRERLWTALLADWEVSKTAEMVRLEFGLRYPPESAPGGRLRLAEGVAERLRDFLSAEDPRRLDFLEVQYTTERDQSDWADSTPLGSEVLKALWASAVGPLFAKVVNAREDRTCYVGLLYRPPRLRVVALKERTATDEYENLSSKELTDLFEDVRTHTGRTKGTHTESSGDWRLILLVGPPRIGKTYTALYHLYQCFCQGDWVRRLPLAPGDTDVKSLLNDLRHRRRDKPFQELVKWVFLEDPFGTSTFIDRNYEDFVSYLNELGSLGVGVVLTTRPGPWDRVYKGLRENYSFPFREVHLGDADSETLTGVNQPLPVYELDDLVSMVFDNAILNEASWVDDQKQHETLKQGIKAALENYLIYPADIVVWSALAGGCRDREVAEILKRIPVFGAAWVAAAIAEDIALGMSPSECIALLLPLLLLLDWKQGKQLAFALGSEVGRRWEELEEHQNNGLIITRIGSGGQLERAEYCCLFNEVYAEAFWCYLHTDPKLINVLTEFLDQLFRGQNVPLQKVDPFLVIELIRRRTLIAAALRSELGRFPDTSSTGVKLEPLPEPWLTLDRRQQILRNGDAVGNRDNPVFTDRAHALLHLMTIIDYLPFPCAFREYDQHSRQWKSAVIASPDPDPPIPETNPLPTACWKEVEQAVWGGKLWTLAAVGNAFGEVLRSPTKTALVNDHGFHEFLGRFAIPDGRLDLFPPLQVVMTYSLVLGSIMEKAGEADEIDEMVKARLGGIAQHPPATPSQLAAWLVWLDILVWKAGDLIRYLADPWFADEPPKEVDRAKRLLSWLSEQVEALWQGMDNSPPTHVAPGYVSGWVVASLFWHNDWCYAGEEPHSAAESGNAVAVPREMARAYQYLAAIWDQVFLGWEKMRQVRPDPLFAGFFDNAAYHARYQQVEASEWARLLAVRPPRERWVRLGSDTHHETGLITRDFPAKSRHIGEQQDKVWQEAVERARNCRGQRTDRTWDTERVFPTQTGTRSSAGRHDESPPWSALPAVCFLLVCRSAAHRAGECDDPYDPFRRWFHERLIEKAPDTKGPDAELWEVALDLYRQGFRIELPDASELGWPPDELLRFWKQMKERYIQQGLIPNELFVARVNSDLESRYGTIPIE